MTWEFEDADNDLMTVTNASFPANIGLTAEFFYPSDEHCFWFARSNATETVAGLANGTEPYPWLMKIDKPTAYTQNSLWTLKEYSGQNHCLEMYLDDHNQTLGTWNVTEVIEDALATKVVKTSTLAFSSGQTGFYIYNGYDEDWNHNWLANDTGYTDWSGKGSYGLDYVTLSANAGNDFTVVRGTTKTFDFTGSTGENAITNYTCIITDSSGVVQGTIYTSTPSLLVNYTATRSGVYTCTLTTTDDEGATDTDTATMTVTTATLTAAGSGTTASGSSSYDWGDNWWEIWTGDWWRALWDWFTDDVLTVDGLAIGFTFLLLLVILNYLWDHKKNVKFWR